MYLNTCPFSTTGFPTEWSQLVSPFTRGHFKFAALFFFLNVSELSTKNPLASPLQLTLAASERSASQPLASFNARAGSSASLDGDPAAPPSPYLFCGSVNGGLVVKRRDCLGPLSRQLRVALHGRGRPKPAAARARYRRDCLGDGGQQEAAEPRPGRAGDTAQHLRRRASQSRKHFETSRGL